MNNKNVVNISSIDNKKSNEVRNGPEFAPIRDFVKSFKIKVTVYDQNDDVIRIEVMDYGKPEDRVWLGKLSYWSWNNGHYVETEALKE